MRIFSLDIWSVCPYNGDIRYLEMSCFFTLAYVARGLYHAGSYHVGFNKKEAGNRALDGACPGSGSRTK